VDGVGPRPPDAIQTLVAAAKRSLVRKVAVQEDCTNALECDVLVGIGEVLRVYEEAGVVRTFAVRHEAEASHAAEALRWVTGEKAAVFTSIGPGALNAFSASLVPASNGLGVWYLFGDENHTQRRPEHAANPQGRARDVLATQSDDGERLLSAYSIVTAADLCDGTMPSKNDRPNIGCIGVGWMGSRDLHAASQVGQVVAVCDVDRTHVEAASDGGKRTMFGDYRKLLDRKDIVTISTPDHWHTRIAMDALKAGKDIYWPASRSRCRVNACRVQPAPNVG
jgi:hypothetical protein